VGALAASDLQALHRAGYYRGNCVIAAAGNVNHDQLLTVLEREGWFEGAAPEPARPRVESEPRGAPCASERATPHKATSSWHRLFRWQRSARYALAILSNLLGGGMSSRLFQRVREELGLAYAVYAFHHLYQSAGSLGVYVGTHPGSAAAAEEAIREELQRLAREGLSPEDLAGGQRQLKGQIMLALESPSSRMHRLAGTVLHGDRYRRLDEILAEIDGVTTGSLSRPFAAEYFEPGRWCGVRVGAGARSLAP
jgi:predicted Zn-dependent peptidase